MDFYRTRFRFCAAALTMKNLRSRFYDVLFVLVLLGAASLRLMGLDWDQSQHLHPDERFMTMVSTALEPVKSVSEFFDTANSTMNPNNRGYGFYVYGTLPVFIVRYVADWMSHQSVAAASYVLQSGTSGLWGGLMSLLGQKLNWAGYDEITLVGRVFSALSDLGSIFFLYLIAARLYGRKVALLAAIFSSLAVMQIQQAHFYTVDSFANFFIFLATYFAVEVMMGDEDFPAGFGQDGQSILRLLFSPLVLNSIGFGLALGASVASKLNAAPLAILLPGALLLRYFRTRPAAQAESVAADESAPVQRTSGLALEAALALLVLGGLFTLVAFRVFQPYAFSGPGFLGLKPNPHWVQNIADQRAQAGGDVDFPPALQWARRPIWFSGYNLVAWGLGWPLGLLAAAGFVLMGWRMLKPRPDSTGQGDWTRHLLLWGWVAFYFGWQSLQWNPTMRYELPIYPLLAMLAAWALVESSQWQWQKLQVKWISAALGLIVLLGTLAWAYAFTRIYTRDHSRVQATHWIFQNVPGPINLQIRLADGSTMTQPLPMTYGYLMAPGMPYETQFNAFASGTLTGITLGHAVDSTAGGMQTLTALIASEPGFPPEKTLGLTTLSADFAPQTDARGASYNLAFAQPLAFTKGQVYYLRLAPTGFLALAGSAPVHETSWDDGLPLRMDGFDAYGGIYQGELNFEMYWDDNQEKFMRFTSNLDAGDYIFITSNRQWATTTRLPERYPLTTAYYRTLIGCPADKDVIWCYNVAEPGMFQGQLGFELVKTFTSFPELPGGYQINTQFAEEAFTVYDAPKVLIFKKTAAYSSANVRSLLGQVDLSKVVHITPRQANNYPGDLMLPPARLASQQQGGTWNQLFSYETLQNRYPVLGLLLWYLTLAILGLFTWPILRYLLPGLSDAGYPLARLAGLLLLAWFAWLVGSLGGEYSRGVIVAGYGLIVLAGALTFWWKREVFAAEIRSRGKYFLLIEGLFLLFFLIDLAIRLGNPDLWHPGRGGERPMDFSYLNAVLKSTSFPPYDPWYAAGYINYYYWGFVLVGTPIKMLGIVPSIAYNFVLPSLFALLGLGAFSVAWNLLSGVQPGKDPQALNRFSLQLLAGLAAGAGLVLIGNLGTIQLIYHALQKMVVANQVMEAPDVSIFQHLAWAAQGLGQLLSFNGATLPIGWGEWYWSPSRVMPVGDLAITEFPLFTFLYSDLHAHMIALPLTVLAVAWALSTLMARNLPRWQWLATLAFGGLVIGSLRPTNTWDFPTYLALGMLVTGYAVFRYVEVGETQRFGLSPLIQRALLALLAMAALAACALLFFEPFARWYGLGYSKVEQWKNEKTPIWSYLTHWGLFLFVIVSWMMWETRQWLAQTPLSALAKLKPYAILIELALALLVVLTVGLQFILDVRIAWLALPLAAWALTLILRPGQPDAKRLVLFMVGTGLVLTLIVEFIVLVGDIGRMNTVFKFYLQVWVLFALSAAAAFGWLMNEIDQWKPGWRNGWTVAGTLLFAGAFLFLFTGSLDKIRDRIAADIPFTFDSMTYMAHSSYWDQAEFSLDEDYRAIRWMQTNISGSPVIVEANAVEYRWGTRYTIYTGLPGVVGWNWHQRQQRALFPSNWVTDRVEEIGRFYNSNSRQESEAFLRKYNVQYIIVGQLERIYYPGGIEKFERYNGVLWQSIYQDGQTTIYQVTP